MTPMQFKGRQIDHNQKLLGAALLFWFLDLRTEGSMGASLYGQWAATISASVWAMGFVGSAMLPLLGILINGRWRYSPLLRIGGYATQILMFAGLCYSALGAPLGTIVVAFSAVYFLPTCIGFLSVNVADARSRWKGRRDEHSA